MASLELVVVWIAAAAKAGQKTSVIQHVSSCLDQPQALLDRVGPHLSKDSGRRRKEIALIRDAMDEVQKNRAATMAGKGRQRR